MTSVHIWRSHIVFVQPVQNRQPNEFLLFFGCLTAVTYTIFEQIPNCAAEWLIMLRGQMAPVFLVLHSWPLPELAPFFGSFPVD